MSVKHPDLSWSEFSKSVSMRKRMKTNSSSEMNTITHFKHKTWRKLHVQILQLLENREESLYDWVRRKEFSTYSVSDTYTLKPFSERASPHPQVCPWVCFCAGLWPTVCVSADYRSPASWETGVASMMQNSEFFKLLLIQSLRFLLFIKNQNEN